MNMAKKKKQRKNNSIQSSLRSQNMQQNAAFRLSPSGRKSGRYLTLAIMGGAAFIALKGCDSSANDNEGDGVFYATPQACVDDGNSPQVCSDAWNNAKAKFEADMPKNMSQESCKHQFENCYYDNIENSWVPVISGFLLNKKPIKEADEEYRYTSGGSYYTSRPVWRSSSSYVWRSGKQADGKMGYTTKRVSTISRGGYGRSSSARGSWGG